MRTKIQQIFQKLIFIFFSILMFYTAWYMVSVMYNKKNISIIVLCLLLCVAFMFICYYIAESLLSKKFDEKKFVIFMILLSFLLRCVGIVILKTEQCSDFASANQAILLWNERGNYIQGDTLDWTQRYYAKFPAWYSYAMIIRTVYNVFNHGIVDAEVAKYFQAIISSLTTGVLYYVAKHNISKRSAVTVAILWTFLPMSIEWISIMTPDHFTIFFMSCEMLVWTALLKSKKKNSIMILAVYGVICGFINWFKPLSILFILVYIGYKFLTGTWGDPKSENNIKAEIKQFCCVIIIVFISITLMSKILIYLDEKQIQTDVVDSTWQYIYAGAVMGEDGSWDVTSANTVITDIYSKYGNDYVSAQKEFKKLAIKEYKDNFPNWGKLWIDKYNEVFYGEGLWYWLVREGTHGEIVNEAFGLIHYFVGGILWQILLLLSGFAGLRQVLKMRNQETIHIILTIVGFLCITVLSVAQKRYKIVILPQFLIMSMWGVEFINDICIDIKNRLLDKITHKQS